ncbi:unnamed protein product [Cylindrotheca closterium]|uniref:C2 domain-containing protein n=1 Tax=Cylindrotheca closterium TaxID=2856 RepID=A0AAD2CDJ1_9STRA|nr:unnamed protein product [Cylindrotheca closterium]
MSNRSKYQITIYASSLKNVAGFGKGTSDPYAVVTLLAGSDDERAHILGRTEVVKNDLSPSWTTTFIVNHCFGKETRINIGVFDEVRKSKGNKSMGSAQFEIGEILGAKGNVKAKRLKPGGTLFVRVTKASDLDLGTFHLGLKGMKLKNMDGMFGKSDPFFVVETYTKGSHGGRQWQPVHRSEHVMNNLNPDWKEVDIPVEKLCNGDKEQPIQISVYDWEKNGKHQSMGKCQTSTNGLLAAVQQQNSFDLIRKGKSYGKVLVTRAEISGQEMNPNKPPPKFASVKGVRQINPDYKKWQAKYGRGGMSGSMSGPSSQHATDVGTPPRGSSHGSNHGSSSDRRSDRRSDGKSSSSRRREKSPKRSNHHDSVSSRNGSNYNDPTDPAISSLSNRYPSYTSESSLPPAMEPPTMSSLSIEPSAPTNDKPKFVDYISGGTEINLSVAIDFTGSNGDPRKPGTLHYIHRDGQLNDYEKALTAVASVVARYDSDQLFPVYGFGAKFGGVIEHCFQVGKSTELKGISGMIEGYRNVFKSGLTMSGPTVFGEVILQAAVQAQSKQEAEHAAGKQSYSILLILTDGDVSDLEDTKQAIKYASSAPLSIVIVGVGDEDFSKMQWLDDFHVEDDEVRDIVQFVEFNKHRDNRQHLTQETLDEIPDQLVDYFLGEGIMPLPPISDNRMSIMPEDFNSSRDVDLDIRERSNGDLELRNSSMARFDTKSYGNTAGFMGGQPSLAGAPIAEEPSLGTPYRSQSAPAHNPSTPASPQLSQSTSGQYSAPDSRSQNHAPSSSSGYATGGRSHSDMRSGGGQRSYSPVPPSRSQPSYGGNQPSYGGSGYGQPNPMPSYGGSSMPSNSNSQYQQYNSSAGPPIVQAAQPVTLRVKAPPNSYPGMQIRVAHPQTGQLHVVSIPDGVHPGGDFRVNLA